MPPRAIHASSSGAPCAATASCWCCARSRVIVHRPRAYCSGLRRMAYRTISANSGLVARAATWRRHGRCSPDDASIATSAPCCCRRRVRRYSTRCWQHGSNAPVGTRRWKARSGPSPDRARGSAPSPSAMPWPSEPPTQGDAGALEREIGAAHGDLVAGLAAARMDQERRPLRLLPGHLRWRWLADDALELSFELPAGAYATVVVREVATV